MPKPNKLVAQDTAQIRAVGFDYLGVTALLPARHESIYQRVARMLGVGGDDVYASYHHHNQPFQRGEYGQAELWRRIVAELGHPGKLEIVLAAAREDVPLPDERILQLADRLRAAGYKVGLLSNLASGTDWDAAMHAAGVDAHFDALLLSGDLGLTKPDPRAFQALADRLGVVLAELVFIDDRAISLAGIEAYGVRPVLYQGYESLLGALAALGVNCEAKD